MRPYILIDDSAPDVPSNRIAVPTVRELQGDRMRQAVCKTQERQGRRLTGNAMDLTPSFAKDRRP